MSLFLATGEGPARSQEVREAVNQRGLSCASPHPPRGGGASGLLAGTPSSRLSLPLPWPRVAPFVFQVPSPHFHGLPRVLGVGLQVMQVRWAPHRQTRDPSHGPQLWDRLPFPVPCSPLTPHTQATRFHYVVDCIFQKWPHVLFCPLNCG